MREEGGVDGGVIDGVITVRSREIQAAAEGRGWVRHSVPLVTEVERSCGRGRVGPRKGKRKGGFEGLKVFFFRIQHKQI